MCRFYSFSLSLVSSRSLTFLDALVRGTAGKKSQESVGLEKEMDGNHPSERTTGNPKRLATKQHTRHYLIFFLLLLLLLLFCVYPFPTAKEDDDDDENRFIQHKHGMYQ